jgi:hypothetical protein
MFAGKDLWGILVHRKLIIPLPCFFTPTLTLPHQGGGDFKVIGKGIQGDFFGRY